MGHKCRALPCQLQLCDSPAQPHMHKCGRPGSSEKAMLLQLHVGTLVAGLAMQDKFFLPMVAQASLKAPAGPDPGSHLPQGLTCLQPSPLLLRPLHQGQASMVGGVAAGT